MVVRGLQHLLDEHKLELKQQCGVFRKQLESVECYWRTKFELTESALVSDIGEEKRKRRDMIQDQLNKSRQKQSELRAKLKYLEEINLESNDQSILDRREQRKAEKLSAKNKELAAKWLNKMKEAREEVSCVHNRIVFNVINYGSY